MDASDIIFVVIGAFEILAGLASLFTGKIYMMGKSVANYTDESLKKFSKPLGISNIFVGAGLILAQCPTPEAFKIGSYSVSYGIIGLVVLCAIGLTSYFVGKKVLVKK